MIWSGVFLVFVGFFQASMDTLDFHYGLSLFARLKRPQFWDPDLSWKNKYAKAEGNEIWITKQRFFGSETFLVWLTDGWHMVEFCRNAAIVFSILFFPGIPLNWWILAYLVAGKVIIGLSFSAAYALLKVKNLEL